MKKIINKLDYFIKNISNIHIGEHAAECAYFTILAFIPLIMLILTLTKYIGLDQSTVLSILEKFSSNNLLNNAILGIIREVCSKSVGTVTISAIVVLWSAGKGFWALCKGLNVAYEVKGNNKFVYSRIRALICTIIFILLIVGSLLLLVFGNTINSILQKKFNIFSVVINIILKSKELISIVVLTIVFMMMYKFIPKHKYKLKYQIPGAIFAAVACNIISGFYSIYVNVFTGFSVMYGSLTTIVLAMMWVYGCMYCILLGAVINKMISEKNAKKQIEK